MYSATASSYFPQFQNPVQATAVCMLLLFIQENRLSAPSLSALLVHLSILLFFSYDSPFTIVSLFDYRPSVQINVPRF
jgi:hypothetical protein